MQWRYRGNPHAAADGAFQRYRKEHDDEATPGRPLEQLRGGLLNGVPPR
ncbi:MAG: hypothetical protein KY476_26965 [Planctomycetes bacterium]|nr:hypothetical protein [Planctomycetota bacterium]